ncbi:MAG: substrate-binding domain-containing protein [Victivallales bacterium]
MPPRTGVFCLRPFPKQQKVFGRFACFVRTMRSPRDNDNYFNEINTGIQIEAGNRRIDLLLPHHAALLDAYVPSPEMLDGIRRAMLSCADSVDGFLLDERIPDETVAEVIEKTKKPAVVINRRTKLPVNMVCPDNENALRMIHDMGSRMKYTQFIFCAKRDQFSYDCSDYNSTERAALFHRLFKDEKHELIENCLMVPREIYLKKIDEAYRRRRKQGRVLLICTTDVLAADLISHFLADGKLPDDLGIAGLEGLAVSRKCAPTLSSMRVDTLAVGMKAVEVLQLSVNGTDSYLPSTVLVPSVFEPGGSMN